MCITLFSSFLWRLLYDEFSFPFLNLVNSLRIQETPGKIAYIWQIKRVQTDASAIKFALGYRFTEIGQIFHNISQLSCKASSKVNGSGQDPIWMTRKPRKGDLREFKAQNFPGSAQEACAFGARLGNQSVFTPDPRLVWRTQIHYSHCIHNWRITEFELHPSVLCVFGAGMMLCCLSA